MDIRGPQANTMGLSRGDHAYGMKVTMEKVFVGRWTIIHGSPSLSGEGLR